MTHASHIPVTKTIPERDIVRPMSNERARAAYLESQIKDMSSVRLPLNIPSMEDESHVSTDLIGRINTFCKEQKEKRRQEWESHRRALAEIKQSKHKHLKRKTEKLSTLR